ncbi:MAG: class I SAM-dependent methyltransferase [Phycisphaerae bacterium]|nr:class I SAM-dependent methyltransferase [Phycisphaerae bacterium]MDW8262809.1 class I SAM-dependent methyltransferase [Phycisphaerales bacterium]
MAVAAILKTQRVEEMNDAAGFCASLRQCLEPLKCSVRFVKDAPAPFGDQDKVFRAFASLLGACLPPVPVPLAVRFAQVADSYRGMHQIVQKGCSAADVSRHFVVASSSARKGRLLAAVVTHFKPSNVFELGTAYGVSALFIAASQRTLGMTDRRLTTVEGFEPQASLSRAFLQAEFGDRVRCEFGLARNAIPQLVSEMKHVQFYFHDGGHT